MSHFRYVAGPRLGLQGFWEELTSCLKLLETF